MLRRHGFWLLLALITVAYLGFWVAMLVATATYTSPAEVWNVLVSREIQWATYLSIITCTNRSHLSSKDNWT